MAKIKQTHPSSHVSQVPTSPFKYSTFKRYTIIGSIVSVILAMMKLGKEQYFPEQSFHNIVRHLLHTQENSSSMKLCTEQLFPQYSGTLSEVENTCSYLKTFLEKCTECIQITDRLNKKHKEWTQTTKAIKTEILSKKNQDLIKKQDRKDLLERVAKENPQEESILESVNALFKVLLNTTQHCDQLAETVSFISEGRQATSDAPLSIFAPPILPERICPLFTPYLEIKNAPLLLIEQMDQQIERLKMLLQQAPSQQPRNPTILMTNIQII